ncbi:MAG: glycine cleavage system aminomethyltransferase GcvT [Thiotrichales bacterium]
MTQRTALYAKHLEQHGRMVDFAGWEMPLNYGSQLEEHHQVRRDAGLFDVSHMTVVDLRGARVAPFLRYLLANDVAKLRTPCKALYGCMLNEQGGVIDDLISYYLSDDYYRVVVNAATREKDLAWMTRQAAPFGVQVIPRNDLAMLAVQGPNARQRVLDLLDTERRGLAEHLGAFFGVHVGDWFIARTGYTGEDGFEVMLPNRQAPDFWDALLASGVKPCGLGARDTLRLEAGMNLYGTDMDETVSPLESGLGWTVAWQPETRGFIGRAALSALHERDDLREWVGLVLEERGVLRGHQLVTLADGRRGETTSGTFSPTLQRAIALARVPAKPGERCNVEIRGRQWPARIVKPVFVRHGESLIET